jgi:hypothetical protein
MATQTLAILRKFSDLGLENIPAKAEEVVHEYRRFAENTYEVVTADVNFGSVIQNVISQISEDIDLFAISSPYRNPDL